MKKSVLLSIAILLAVCMNGILICELMGHSNATEIAINDTVVPPMTSPIPKQPRAEEKVDMDILLVPADGALVGPSVLPPRRVVCYNHWDYKPYQPVRNLVRYFHNNRPLRRLICPRSLFIRR